MNILGLFDRPASADCIRALIADPVIPNLTESLQNLSDADWNLLLAELEKSRLIVSVEDSFTQTGIRALDAHPLVREYFCDRFKKQHPASAASAHSRIFNFLVNSTKSEHPSTVSELEPLYRSILHGCAAGCHAEAFKSIYRHRINRGSENYGYKIGALSFELGALSAFFDSPWKVPCPHLETQDKIFILSQVGSVLRALGRFKDALSALTAGYQLTKNSKKLEGTWFLGSMSDLRLYMGEISISHSDTMIELAHLGARSAVFHAEARSSFLYSANRMHTLTIPSVKEYFDDITHIQIDTIRRLSLLVSRTARHATALHFMGDNRGAKKHFNRAERKFKNFFPEHDKLISIPGSRFNEFLLQRAERYVWILHLTASNSTSSSGQLLDTSEQQKCLHDIQSVKERVTASMKCLSGSGSRLEKILDELLGLKCTLFEIAIKQQPIREHFVVQLAEEADKIVTSLSSAGHFEDRLQGYLLRALLTALVGGDRASITCDLDEAQRIAIRGSMKVLLADVCLHRARIFHDLEELERARQLIEETGYERRRGELEDAEERLQSE